jgi:hypothetical protein
MNCSTAAMRHISSSLADPYVSVAGAAAALFGPLHGGANEVRLTDFLALKLILCRQFCECWKVLEQKITFLLLLKG